MPAVFYGGAAAAAPAMAGREVYVLGGANSAGQPRCTSPVTRGASRSWCALRRSAPGCRTTSFARWRRRQSWRFDSGPRSSGVRATGGSSSSVLRDRADGSEETVDAEALFLLIGAHPHTEWLPPEVDRDSGGFVLTGPTFAMTAIGRSSAVRFRSRRACRESSPPATVDTAPSSDWRLQLARAQSPLSSSTTYCRRTASQG